MKNGVSPFNGFKFEATRGRGIRITNYTGEAERLVIPEAIDGVPVRPLRIGPLPDART